MLYRPRAFVICYVVSVEDTHQRRLLQEPAKAGTRLRHQSTRTCYCDVISLRGPVDIKVLEAQFYHQRQQDAQLSQRSRVSLANLVN